MMTNINIRPVKSSDLDDLKEIIEANDLFPPDMLDGMIADFFDDENNSDLWLTYESNKPEKVAPVAIAYCAPEQMTEGTWNLYLIAVHPDYQSQGIGTSMVNCIEETLKERGERLILVETSSLPDFERTRDFYKKLSYQQEAQIREFYQAGEDKIVFRKLLTRND